MTLSAMVFLSACVDEILKSVCKSIKEFEVFRYMEVCEVHKVTIRDSGKKRGQNTLDYIWGSTFCDEAKCHSWMHILESATKDTPLSVHSGARKCITTIS
ncbi:hypothetical protein SO802_014013 [Lithocarpus litseifolius]|uniref:Uncharacterized protein n=1 Tax=Lithocarpus litseifolius TaxID=425828 RepID=A0AAW2D9A9_9ROSI